MPHFLWTDEECVLQVTGVGPWRLTPVDAAPSASRSERAEGK
jgi:hypothetical protein